MFFIGITVGRAINGFLSLKLNDTQLIRLGQVIIGVQMASAYVGNILMPPLFGWIAENISIRLFPVYLIMILMLMVAMYKRMLSKQNKL